MYIVFKAVIWILSRASIDNSSCNCFANITFFIVIVASLFANLLTRHQDIISGKGYYAPSSLILEKIL